MVTVTWKLSFADSGILKRALDAYVTHLEETTKTMHPRDGRGLRGELLKAKELQGKVEA